MLRSLHLAAALLVLGTAAAQDAATCAATGRDGRCLPGEDDASAMLQQHTTSALGRDAGAKAARAPRAAGRRVYPNTTALWHQLQGAVSIDHLQEQIAAAGQGVNMTELQAHLNVLIAEFPSSQKMHELFKDKWEQITAAVDLQNVTACLQDWSTQALGNDTMADLQAQADAFSQKLSGFSIDDIKDQVSGLWADMTDHNVSLPDLDELEAHTQSVIEHAHDMLQGMLSSAKSALSGAKDALQDAVGGAFDGLSNVFR